MRNYITNCLSQLFPIPRHEHLYDVKVKVRQQKPIQYCVRAGMDYRTGLPGPGQGAHVLDFVFVNITGGSNVSLICGWKLCILLHVQAQGPMVS